MIMLKSFTSLCTITIQFISIIFTHSTTLPYFLLKSFKIVNYPEKKVVRITLKTAIPEIERKAMSKKTNLVC